MSNGKPIENETPRSASIIVACRNEQKHIGALLDAIFGQQTRGIDLEVIIADGMSEDGTKEILERTCQKHPHVRVIDNPKRFVSHGLNLAIAAARGEFILRMDAHSEYAPDYVERCLTALLETGAANVGGPARTKSEGLVGQAVAAAYHSPFSTGGAKFHDETYEGVVDTVPYGCWRKSTLQSLGMFDESLVRNQDDELNLRIIRSGGRIWQSPLIKSWYWPRATLGALWRQYFQYGFWKVKVIRKHRIPASWRHLIPAAFVMGNIALLLAVSIALLTGGARSLEVLLFTWGAAVLAYTSACAAASLAIAKKAGWRLLPVLPAIFGTYHFSYGTGFLLGLFYWRGSHKGEFQTKEFFTQLSR